METNNYEPQENHMRRRRNVNFNEDREQLHSEQTTHLGIQWGDSASVNDSEETDSTESCNNAPKSNWEKALATQDQGKTISFRVENFEVSIGQLAAPKNSENTQKLTLHIDADLVEVLKQLKKAQFIPSYSWLVSEAVKQYLICNGS